MPARLEAYGWACVYGLAMGTAAAAWQDAHEAGAAVWAGGFAAWSIAAGPVLFGLQWREIRG